MTQIDKEFIMHHDVRDVDLTTESLIKTEAGAVMLVDAVANKRLFLLNGRNELEEVILASYWKPGRNGEQLLSVCSNGYEYDENGEVTRDWR